MTIGLICLLAGSGCATQSKSMALGGAIGMGSGAVLGGIVSPGRNGEFRTRNVLIGSAIGGVAGMITGSAIQGSIEDKEKSAFERGKSSSIPTPPGTVPNLSTAKYDAKWIEGKIMGNRFVESHWEWLITEPAHWEER